MHPGDELQPGSMRNTLSFAALLEALPVAAYTCDPDGLITLVNDKAVALWGRGPDLLDPETRWCGAVQMRSAIDGTAIDPEHWCMANAIRTGEPCQEEVLFERVSGEVINVLAQASPVHDSDGTVTGVVGVLTDVTMIRQAEIAQARLGAIVASSDDAIISKTLEGRIVSWNEAAERLFGYTSTEAVGQPVTLIIPEERRGEEREILAKLVKGERVDHYETIRVHKHGTQLNISLTSSPIRDSTGRIVGASKIARDITARKRNEEHLRMLHDEMQQADSAKNNFLATLAHELRNPLAPIRHLITLLERSRNPAVELVTALPVMDRQLTQMARLIDDLMDISRISKNKFDLRRERINLTSAIETAIDASRPMIEAHGHRLVIDVPDEPILLDADAARLTQAIGNVLNNAAKYTDPDGEIALRVWRENGNAMISVTDSGIGIPSGMLTQIFEMFVQIDTSVNRGQGGLGVGLHLASKLIEMHGGTLRAKSQGIGKGSTFLFVIPLEARTAPLQSAAAKVGTAAAETQHRILVVDDNRDAADSLAMLLQVMGSAARAVYDGPSALAAGAEWHPDVVLLDIGLPGMDGYEAARRIRETAWGSSVRLCALTGWGQEDARRQSRDAGFDAHFVKPVDAIAMMTAIDHI